MSKIGPLGVSLIYALLGIGAIFFVDSAILAHPEALLAEVLEHAAGLIFILGSTILLYVAWGRWQGAQRRALAELEAKVAERTEALAREVADRRRAEEAAKTSEERFRDAAESASDWFWEADSGLILRFLSERFAASTQQTPRMVLGRPLAEAFVAEERAGALDSLSAPPLSQALAERQAFRDVTLRLKLPGGAPRLIRLSGRPIFDENGDFRGYRGAGDDVTERAQALRQAERLRHRHNLLLDSLDEGVFEVDQAGVIGFANPAAERLTGWRSVELVGRTAHDVLHHGEMDAGHFGHQDCPIVEAARTGQTCRKLQDLFRRRDGTTFYADYVGSPIREDGRTIGAVIAFRDASERRRAEQIQSNAKEEAEAASKAKSNFLAQLSHEVRTPLNAIIGFSDVILSGLFGSLGSPRYVEYVRDIHSSAQHLLNLISDIVDISRIETGIFELKEHPIDVGKTLESCVAMVRERATLNGTRVVLDIASNLPALFADERRMKQVFLNLLSNAIKFTPAEGSVTVVAQLTPKSDLIVAIADTGVGMPAENIPKVLKIFGHGETMMARRAEGSGIGLPLASRLVELHGGTLEIASTVGVGTNVTVRLPGSRLLYLEQSQAR